MKKRRDVVRVFSVSAIALILSGSASAADPKSLPFSAYLQEGYRQLAAEARRSPGNAGRASYFVRRSIEAEAATVPPEGLDGRQLDSWTLREAGFARRQFVTRLESGA